MHRLRSRVSLVLLAFVFALVVPILCFDELGVDPNEKQVAYGILGLSIGLMLLLMLGIRYEVSKTELIIRIGPVPYPFGRVGLDEIRSVERSYVPLSAPASSLKRLLVCSNRGKMLISPANEAEFIRLLKTRNPNIKVTIDDKNDWWRFWDWDV